MHGDEGERNWEVLIQGEEQRYVPQSPDRPDQGAAQAAGIRFRTCGKAKPRQPGSSSSGLPKHCSRSWSGKVRTRPIQPMSASIAASSDPSGTAGSTPSTPRTPMPITVRTGMSRQAAAYHHSPTRHRFRPPSSPRTPRFPRVRPVTTIAEISGPVTPRVCSTMTSGEAKERPEVGASVVQDGQRHPEQPGDGERQQQVGGEGVPHDPRVGGVASGGQRHHAAV